MSNSRFDGWQYAQLERFFAEHPDDGRARDRCLRLSNPEVEREIDAIVLGELWPGVVGAMRGRPVTTWISPDNVVEQALKTLNCQHVARSLTFQIVDPECSITPWDHKPWHCRFTVETTLAGYSLRKATILSFPEDFSMGKLTRILKEPLMQGYPAELRWSGGRDGGGAYAITLEGGRGADWSPWIRTEDARESIQAAIGEELDLLSMMDTLAKDWNDATAFEALYELLVEAYLCY